MYIIFFKVRVDFVIQWIELSVGTLACCVKCLGLSLTSVPSPLRHTKWSAGFGSSIELLPLMWDTAVEFRTPSFGHAQMKFCGNLRSKPIVERVFCLFIRLPGVLVSVYFTVPFK